MVFTFRLFLYSAENMNTFIKQQLDSMILDSYKYIVFSVPLPLCSPTRVETAVSEVELVISPKIQPFCLEDADPADLQLETQNEASTSLTVQVGHQTCPQKTALLFVAW